MFGTIGNTLGDNINNNSDDLQSCVIGESRKSRLHKGMKNVGRRLKLTSEIKSKNGIRTKVSTAPTRFRGKNKETYFLSRRASLRVRVDVVPVFDNEDEPGTVSVGVADDLPSGHSTTPTGKIVYTSPLPSSKSKPKPRQTNMSVLKSVPKLSLKPTSTTFIHTEDISVKSESTSRSTRTERTTNQSAVTLNPPLTPSDSKKNGSFVRESASPYSPLTPWSSSSPSSLESTRSSPVELIRLDQNFQPLLQSSSTPVDKDKLNHSSSQKLTQCIPLPASICDSTNTDMASETKKKSLLAQNPNNTTLETTTMTDDSNDTSGKALPKKKTRDEGKKYNVISDDSSEETNVMNTIGNQDLASLSHFSSQLDDEDLASANLSSAQYLPPERNVNREGDWSLPSDERDQLSGAKASFSFITDDEDNGGHNMCQYYGDDYQVLTLDEISQKSSHDLDRQNHNFWSWKSAHADTFSTDGSYRESVYRRRHSPRRTLSAGSGSSLSVSDIDCDDDDFWSDSSVSQGKARPDTRASMVEDSEKSKELIKNKEGGGEGDVEGQECTLTNLLQYFDCGGDGTGGSISDKL
uniref:Uncharacterized protein n=2 Tax=Corethron hystrix TaxID=216773 RepID=A0A7S1BJU8_9STRA